MVNVLTNQSDFWGGGVSNYSLQYRWDSDTILLNVIPETGKAHNLISDAGKQTFLLCSLFLWEGAVPISPLRSFCQGMAGTAETFFCLFRLSMVPRGGKGVFQGRLGVWVDLAAEPQGKMNSDVNSKCWVTHCEKQWSCEAFTNKRLLIQIFSKLCSDKAL